MRQDTIEHAPAFRIGCGLAGRDIVRPDWRTTLNEAQLAFVRGVDGTRSIRALAVAVAQASPQAGAAAWEIFGRDLFQSLWRLDFVSVGLRPK